MAYPINKWDGTFLVNVEEGQVEVSTTNLKLVGRGRPNYGEVVNEDLVYLLENFARSTAPGSLAGEANPMSGQLWYNSSTKKVNVWNGTSWVSVGGGVGYVSTTQPTSPQSGEFWWDPVYQILRIYSSGAWVIVPPFISVGTSSPANPSTGRLWLDTNDPNNGIQVYNSGWISQGLIGRIAPFAGNWAPAKWLLLNGQTIGSVASAATNKNAGYYTLFATLWLSWDNTQCPVSGGRGASEVADWNANKSLGIPDFRGRTIIGAGTGSGLTNRVFGTTGGEESHVLTLAESAAHSHAITASGTATGVGDHTHALSLSGITANHTHSGATDVQGNHTHSFTQTNWTGSTEGGDGDPGDPTHVAGATGAAGSHAHNFTTSGVSADHTHIPTMYGAGTHGHTLTITASSDSQGGGTAHNNMQPYVAVNYIVYTGV